MTDDGDGNGDGSGDGNVVCGFVRQILLFSFVTFSWFTCQKKINVMWIVDTNECIGK